MPQSEELCISGFVARQSAIDAVVNSSGAKIGFKLLVDRLRITLVKPHVKLFDLPRRERVYRAFNFLYRV
jgi:hypothetical protein